MGNTKTVVMETVIERIHVIHRYEYHYIVFWPIDKGNKGYLESMGHTGVDYLYWNSDDDTGMVMFVYGNEPEYVVADYSSDKITTRIVETIIDKYQG